MLINKNEKWSEYWNSPFFNIYIFDEYCFFDNVSLDTQKIISKSDGYDFIKNNSLIKCNHREPETFDDFQKNTFYDFKNLYND